MELESLFPRESQNDRRFMLNSPNLWSTDDESVSSLSTVTNPAAALTISDDDDVDDDIENEETRDKTCYVSDLKLIERILEKLPLECLLTCRLVCQKWYDIIGHSPILWDKGCMTFSRRHLCSSAHNNLTSTDLVKKFQCPNFRFYYNDLRHEVTRNFIKVYGPTLKYLSFVNCHMSKSTFDLVLLECPNVVHLAVNNVPRSVSLCRILFPWELNFKLSLTKLESLCLKRLVVLEKNGPRISSKIIIGRNYERFEVERKKKTIKNSCCHQLDNFNGENLSTLFLEQLLESCGRLKKIELANWEGATLYNLMTVLNCRPQFSTLTEISIYNIRSPGGQEEVIESHHFFPLCTKSAHLRLQRLTITLKDPIPWPSKGDEEDKSTDDNNYKDFDTIFELTLQNHCETLHHVDFSNLPVTSKIFTRNEVNFPNLRSLRLLSTWVDDVEKFTLFMPALEIIEYCPLHGDGYYDRDDQNCGEEDDSVRQRNGSNIMMTMEGSRRWSLTDQFHQCSPLDFVCITSLLIILGILSLILLISQFHEYGEYFLGFGLSIFILICLSDFYSDYWHEYFTCW